jgi:hypothetical protein
VDNDEDKSNYDDETAVASLKKELLEALAFSVPPPDDGLWRNQASGRLNQIFCFGVRGRG